ncbi:ATP-binding protein [Fulvitalea axinellae]|uniref:ATP-binding protein n=1 Tax=Fulvitalea axinellae TaxID=1182444 RepID=A0AAU9D2T4_9BACT|nr:ATP-binding protein [Fulvitalea axinellae]
MIQVNNIKKSYGPVTVLNIKQLNIGKGEVVGLVGNNGAGKTTFFRSVLDLILPDTGEVKLNGQLVKGDDSWKSFTGSYLDEGFLIDYLSPEEYFEFIGKLRGLNKADLEEFLAQFEDIFNGEVLGTGKYIRNLSKGNQKKVGIIGALIGNPELLILDEPFANLDPSTQIRLKKLLQNQKAEKGITMFISSHDLSHVTEVCDRIVLLEKGEVVKDAHKDENTLKELEAFFGKDEALTE